MHCVHSGNRRGQIISGSPTGNRGTGSRVATGQVFAAEAPDLLTRRLSHGYKNDSCLSYSEGARALPREGNNLGAVSLHCVLLFPQVRGGYLSQQEENNA